MKNIIEWLYLRQTNNLAYYDRLTQLLNRNWWELYAKKREIQHVILMITKHMQKKNFQKL